MNSIQSKKKSLPLELEQEEKLIKAVYQPKIHAVQDEEIKAVLKYCFALIGLRPEQWPDDLQKMVLLNFIRQNYSGHSLEEIKIAFDFGSAGKLDIEMTHYQNFNCIYLSDVMQAYRKYATEILKQDANTYKEMPPSPLPSNEEQEMNDKNFANEYYRKYLNNEFSLVSLEYAHLIYNTLDKFKLIRYTVARKKEYMVEAQELRLKELNGTSISDFREHQEITKLLQLYTKEEVPEPEKKLLINYAKRLALLDLFKFWKGQNRKRIFE